jgi:predicted phage terminase large subunit-like protein
MSWQQLSRRFAALRKPERVLAPYPEWFRGTIPPSWEVAEHMRFINRQLADLELGMIDRLGIHTPPRHAKTETVTVRGALRWLERRPWDNVLVTAYNERHARRISRKIRTLAKERGLVGREKAAEDEWQTDEGGSVMARGVGNPPTGTGFGVIFIDDPIRRRQDADSETYRERAWDWYTDDLYQRLEPGGSIVMVATLWHHDDVCARAVASEPGRWRVVKLPALAEIDDLMGRAEGRALWPDRWPEEELLRRRAVMVRKEGERNWNSVYQQNPTPLEGAFFKVHRFDLQRIAPWGLPTVRAWDVAATKGGGDGTASVKMCGPDAWGLYYVLDATWGQMDVDERDAFIRRTAVADGPTVRQILPQDPGAAGKAQAAAFVKLLAGLPVEIVSPTGDKEVRAGPYASQVNAGNVVLIFGEWNTDYTDSLRLFPLGNHDDLEDASSDAFNGLAVGVAMDGAVGGPSR